MSLPLITDADNSGALVRAKINAGFSAIDANAASITALSDLTDSEIMDLSMKVSALQNLQYDLLDHDRPGDTPVAFTTSLLGGDPSNLAVFDPSEIVIGSRGSVARVSESVVAMRRLRAIEPATPYQARFIFTRSTNSSDPDNDAVVLSLLCLAADKSVIGTVILETVPSFTVSSGRIQASFVVSDTAATGVDSVVLAGTCYVRAFIQIYGTTQRTDVELIDVRDGSSVAADAIIIAGAKSQTALDRIQTGLDRAQADSDVVQSNNILTQAESVLSQTQQAGASFPLVDQNVSANAAIQSSKISFLSGNQHAVARALSVDLTELPRVTQFGVDNTGQTDVTAKLQQIDGLGVGIVFPAGTYLVSSSVAFGSRVTFMDGAKLKIPDGVTVTFSGGVVAALAQIFLLSGSGAVAISAARTMFVFPEWWGAVTNTSSADCSVAINAALLAGPIVVLQGADYWISSSINMVTGNRALRGNGCRYIAPGDGSTRIVVNSATAHGVIIGVDGPSTAAYPNGIVLSDLQVVRAVPLTAPAAGSELSGPTGVRVLGAVWCDIQNVSSTEHYIGFYIVDTVQANIGRCTAVRSVPAANASAGNDKFFAFVFNGASSNLTQGNASLYCDKCLAVGTPGSVPNSYGFFLQGAFVDTFITRPETSTIGNGIYITGAPASSGTTVQQQQGNADLHITAPILDAYTYSGLTITALSPWGAIAINGGYAAPGVDSATASVVVSTELGAISMTQFQHIGWPHPGVPGALLLNATNCSFRNNMWTESGGVVLDGCSGCVFDDLIKNPGHAIGKGALTLKNVSVRNKIAPVITGAQGVFTCGVELIGSVPSYNEINCTGINPGAITTGNGSPKLVINSAAVTTAGLSGNNLASGVMN